MDDFLPNHCLKNNKAVHGNLLNGVENFIKDIFLTQLGQFHYKKIDYPQI